MLVQTHKQYDKAYAKLTRKQQAQVMATLQLFLTDPQQPKLRLHQLKGRYYPQYSLSVGGDLRIHFTQVSQTYIVLMLVGTHSQLYS